MCLAMDLLSPEIASRICYCGFYGLYLSARLNGCHLARALKGLDQITSFQVFDGFR